MAQCTIGAVCRWSRLSVPWRAERGLGVDWTETSEGRGLGPSGTFCFHVTGAAAPDRAGTAGLLVFKRIDAG